MSSVKLTIMFVICIIACMTPLIVAQCPSSNNARCSVWLQGGFCGSNFYTTLQKQFYCGTQCGLC
ncbi:hypothetical protein PRIPAC_77262 [Pristionchus pacificus]|uniref:Uncharacterized protein n=1 Tax=Pristionchus pacificus TaxID=54126 RepID=A0A2A6C2D9_PRIPA|nr:hypothetical protein PRIPAC_77262 [Pristionchus pacificus]|eukprot:PDM72335.1 hypothetical protein PRIPAC_38769 [Pristionchus pacificus]